MEAGGEKRAADAPPVEEKPSKKGKVGNRGNQGTLDPVVVEYLKKWIFSDEHVENPYPTGDEKKKIMEDTKLTDKQVSQWFSNNRKRLWRPHMEKLGRLHIVLEKMGTAGSRGTGSGSTSGGIPQPVTDYLKNWLLSPEHINNPFPTEEEKERLQAATGLKKKQIQQWFSNNRKRFFSNAISEIREVNGLGEDDLIPHHIAAAAAAEYSTSLESLAAAAPALAVAASQESKVASSELIHPDAVEAAPQVNNAPFMLAPPAFQEDAPIQLAPPAAEPADDGLENIEIVEI